jgi:beta-lactam-binding protein with PASTA domain
MKRFFRIAFAAAAMLTVALVFAALTMRIALHGGEVAVPNFAGMSINEASNAALHKGLGLTVEDKFYSTVVPAGRVLAQSPAADTRVRKKWPVHVTVSLGPQQVDIPDVVGQPQRAAAMSIRRKSLDLGAIAHLGAPGDPDIVLAQSPPPNAGVDRPRVSLLLSQADDEATAAFVMPSFVGLSLGAANRAASALGLKTLWVGETPSAPQVPAGATKQPDGTYVDANGAAIAVSVASSAPGGPVTAQKPEAGHRGTKGDTVRLIFGHGAAAQAAGATP